MRSGSTDATFSLLTKIYERTDMRAEVTQPKRLPMQNRAANGSKSPTSLLSGRQDDIVDQPDGRAAAVAEVLSLPRGLHG